MLMVSSRFLFFSMGKKKNKARLNITEFNRSVSAPSAPSITRVLSR